MTDEPRHDTESHSTCAACGGVPALAYGSGDAVVWLCPACAAGEGLGCP
ncbi:MAG: hypothetical protein WCG96_08390 [Actinomycetes bacterium]